MKDNGDHQQVHFSFYDVLVRNPAISKAMNDNPNLQDCLMAKIKNLGTEEENSEFTAQDLRNKFPVLLRKTKVLNKYIAGEIELDEGYQRAKISQVEERVRKAVDLLDDVERKDILQLEPVRLNAFRQDVRKLSQRADRINRMIKDVVPK